MPEACCIEDRTLTDPAYDATMGACNGEATMDAVKAVLTYADYVTLPDEGRRYEPFPDLTIPTATLWA